MAASSGEAFVDRAARDAAAGTASNEKLPRASCRQAHQAVQTERQEDTEHHGRYTRLDAELAHFHAELSSCNSVWDSVVFFACGALGYLVDSLLYAISGPSSRDRNGWDGFQYAWILMSFTGLIWCFHRSHWFGVSFFVGSSVSLLYRDLTRTPEPGFGRQTCPEDLLDGSMEAAYWWSQAFILLLGPFVSWRVMVTSRALDRVYLPRVRQPWESCAELCKALRRAVSVCETVQPYLTLTIRCQEPEGRSTRSPSQSPSQRNLGPQVKSPISLHFFLDDDVGDGDSEVSEPEEDEEQPWEEGEEARRTLKVECRKLRRDRRPNVGVLVYGRCGDYIHLPQNEGGEANTVTVSSEQYRTFRDHSDPFLLFLFHKKVLLSADATTRRRLCKVLPCVMVPLSALLGAFLWFSDSSLRSAPITRGSLVFLMLPDLVQVFLHSNTTLQHPGSTRNPWAEAGALLQKGSECLRTKTTLGSIIALWDSTFFYCGSFIFIFIGCYQLHAAANSLRELRNLLHLHDHDSPKFQAIILHRLHRIRARIVHKQRLKYIGAHAFPDELKPDLTLGWWFETRALIFSDIKRSVSKRVLILGLCGVAEAVMVVLTCLAVLLDTGNDFEIMCYAAAFGIFLGTMIVLFVYLGNTVNVELLSGLEEIESPDPSGADSPVSPSRSPIGRRVFLTHGRTRDENAKHLVNEFLDYERLHPRQLTFLGVPFTWQFATYYAAPLGTYAIGMIYWILQQAFTNTKHAS